MIRLHKVAGIWLGDTESVESDSLEGEQEGKRKVELVEAILAAVSGGIRVLCGPAAHSACLPTAPDGSRDCSGRRRLPRPSRRPVRVALPLLLEPDLG